MTRTGRLRHALSAVTAATLVATLGLLTAGCAQAATGDRGGRHGFRVGVATPS